MKTFPLISLLILTCFVSSCDKEDEKNSSCNSQGAFTFNLNGTAWTNASFNNTLMIATTAGVDAKRMDIRALANDGSQLVITITDLSTGLNGDCVNASVNYTAVDDVISANQNVFFMTLFGANGSADAIASEGTLDITSCDEGNKTVSGTFTFNGLYNNLDDFIGTQGSFSNLCYTVLR